MRNMILQMQDYFISGFRGRSAIIISCLIIIFSFSGSALADVVAAERVEELSGILGLGDVHFYTLPDLRRGDTLYTYVEGLSGNLDPFLALSGTDLHPGRLKEEYLAMVDREVTSGRDPLLAIPEIAARFFYAWDDDSGLGYSSALSYTVRQSGDYQLIVLGSPAHDTFGAYRLLIGINSPEILGGAAVTTGDTIAFLNRSVTDPGNSVQEIYGSLPSGKESIFYWVNPVRKEDTLYAYLDAGQGAVPPYLFLKDYGEKPVAIGVPSPGTRVSTLSHTFSEIGSGYRLYVDRSDSGDVTTDLAYRLLIGLNEPAVLSGASELRGEPVVEEAVIVYIGIQLDQIADVNQKEENYAVVATVWMTWYDRDVAFSPDSCNCSYKLYRSVSDFTDAEGSHFPEFTLFNQQERRWTQNELIIVDPDGTVTFYERFWTRLQAPDFNFRRYPFD